jgi:hypothetical protein
MYLRLELRRINRRDCSSREKCNPHVLNDASLWVMKPWAVRVGLAEFTVCFICGCKSPKLLHIARVICLHRRGSNPLLFCLHIGPIFCLLSCQKFENKFTYK